MRSMFLSALFLAATSASAMTPQLSGLMRFMNDMPSACTPGQACKQVIWDSICNPNNVIFDANDDGSFDILFLDFKAETDYQHPRATAQCHLEIPVVVPDGYKVALKSVSVAGITEVTQAGLSEASITHTFKSGRESVQTERFRFQNKVQDVIVNHNVDDNWTQCGRDKEAVVATRIEIVAQRQPGETHNTFIEIDEGAARRKAKYKLEYQRCDGQPNDRECKKDEIAFNGKCVRLGKQCSDYDFTNTDICNNGKDTLQCDYVPSTNRCVSKCPQGHFSMDGQCIRIAQKCSEYNGTSSKICNNGNDALQCDWREQSRTCVKE